MSKKDNKSSFVMELLDLLRMFLICFVIVFLLTTFVFKTVKVDGSSMDPTLENGEFGVSNVISAIRNDFDRFDIVIVNVDENGTKEKWVKRIIGLPGETIEYKDDKLYINGEYVEEPFLNEDYIQSEEVQQEIMADNRTTYTEDFGPYTLGDDEYFLMGDHRTVSYDSRYVGTFKENDLVSKNVFIIYPFNHFGSTNLN